MPLALQPPEETCAFRGKEGGIKNSTRPPRTPSIQHHSVTANMTHGPPYNVTARRPLSRRRGGKGRGSYTLRAFFHSQLCVVFGWWAESSRFLFPCKGAFCPLVRIYPHSRQHNIPLLSVPISVTAVIAGFEGFGWGLDSMDICMPSTLSPYKFQR